MAAEISYLIASVFLFLLMIVVQAVFGVLKHGLVPLAGSRDNLGADSVLAQRAKRANQNMIESLVIFAPLVLAAAYLGAFNEMTALGAMLFFFGRLAYAPLYWLGVPWLRTLAWAVALVGIVLVGLQIIPFSGA